MPHRPVCRRSDVDANQGRRFAEEALLQQEGLANRD